MNKFWAITILGIAVAVPSFALAQTSSKPEVLLEAAKKKELLSGDLDAAIRQYRDIVAKYPSNHAVAAEALLHMAQCYEKLGASQAQEAQKAYERIVREYADQKEAFAEAKKHLAGTASRPNSGPFQAIPPDATVNGNFRLSPDGARIVEFNQGGDLIVRDLRADQQRVLINRQGGRIRLPIWSPDGIRAALYIPQLKGIRILNVTKPDVEGQVIPVSFVVEPGGLRQWTKKDEILCSVDRGVMRDGAGGGLGSGDFYLIPVNGGQPRQVFTLDRPDPALFSNITPDGGSIVVVRAEHLAMIDLAAGAEREISLGFGAAYPQVSPDGKLLAYLSRQEGSWAVYVAPLDRLPIRNPVRVASLPSRRKEAPYLGRLQGMKWLPNDRLAFDCVDDEMNLYRIDMDAKIGRPIGQPERLSRDFDAQRPVISPDGRHIAFALPVGTRARAPQRGIVMINSDGSGERMLVDLPTADRFPGISEKTYSWRSSEEILFAKEGMDLLSIVDIRTNAILTVPNSTLQKHTDFPKSPAGGSPPRPAFQFVPARNEIVFCRLELGKGTTTAYDLSYSFRAISLTDGAERIIASIPSIQDWVVSHDGRQIAYMAGYPSTGRIEGFEMHLLAIDGSQDKIVLKTSATNHMAPWAWNADGRRLLCMEGSKMMRVLNVETEETWPLLDKPIDQALGLDGGAWLAGCDWAPDGSFIVFSAASSPTYRLAWEGVTYDAVNKLLNKKAAK